MGAIRVRTLGLKGVNLDKDPLVLEPDELTRAQNAVSDVRGAIAAIVNRPGLAAITPSASGASILGGIGVLTPQGTPGEGVGYLFIGRGGEVP